MDSGLVSAGEEVAPQQQSWNSVAGRAGEDVLVVETRRDLELTRGRLRELTPALQGLAFGVVRDELLEAAAWLELGRDGAYTFARQYGRKVPGAGVRIQRRVLEELVRA